MLAKHYTTEIINITNQSLEILCLNDNDLTAAGMKHLMKIVMKSKPDY